MLLRSSVAGDLSAERRGFCCAPCRHCRRPAGAAPGPGGGGRTQGRRAAQSPLGRARSRTCRLQCRRRCRHDGRLPRLGPGQLLGAPTCARLPGGAARALGQLDGRLAPLRDCQPARVPALARAARAGQDDHRGEVSGPAQSRRPSRPVLLYRVYQSVKITPAVWRGMRREIWRRWDRRSSSQTATEVSLS